MVENGIVIGCSKGATGAIEIPKGVTSIGDEAFRYCRGLTSVTIPEGVMSIRTEAFSDCSSLETVEFKGTKEQWAKVKKGINWHHKSVSATKVTCLDGEASLD